MSKTVRGTRVRKLGTRTAISIYREDEVESDEYQVALSQLAKVSTGVESNEETEYHLQAIISDNLQKDKEIPTGEKARPSNINYEQLYPPTFKAPLQYIAFSQTVEDCTGAQYDMSTEDVAWLKQYNKGRKVKAQCSEDDFEKIMAAFEEYREDITPFAAVDKTVSSFPDMEVYLKGVLNDPRLEDCAIDIYKYWAEKRQAADRGHIQPCLKLENTQTQQESDDNDAYVCFRRREVRQTRKTRARDLQGVERVRALRKTLEDGRTLARMALERDKAQRDLFEMDRLIFAQRGDLKNTKVALNIDATDDDLINARPVKRKMVEPPSTQQRPQPSNLRTRNDGRPFDAEFQLLEERRAEKENMLEEQLTKKLAKYEADNAAWVDCTREPLSPVHEQGVEVFRPATASYLMTPPASASEESMIIGDHTPPMDYKQEQVGNITIGSYRRRWGRGNRLWIDRRGLPSPAKDFDSDDRVADRIRFDQDEYEEYPVYHVDPFSYEQIAYRSTIPITNHFAPAPPRRGIASGSSQANLFSNPTASASHQRQQSQSFPNIT